MDKTSKNDSLGDRMKSYENVTRTYLMPRSYTFLRVDGRAFHSYLKNCVKPFDENVMSDMDNTTIYLCENIQNAKLGYVQSDEITLLLTDFDGLATQQFFDGNIQKICSVVASMATSKFNQLRFQRIIEHKTSLLTRSDIKLAEFDCRCWNVPNQTEAMNTLIWRNQDAARNSVSMVAQSLFSHKELQGKNTSQMQEMMFKEHGINWANYDQSKKNGRLILKKSYYPEPPELGGIARTRWMSVPAWKFTEDKDTFKLLIPQYE